MSDKIGERKNKGKLRWRNFPLFLVRPLIEVGHFGETKYKTFNFLKGLTVLDCMDCIKRHLDKFEDPAFDDNDEESQASHLAHVAWNALVALYMIKNRPDLDDRFKGFDNKLDEAELMELIKKDIVRENNNFHNVERPVKVNVDDLINNVNDYNEIGDNDE